MMTARDVEAVGFYQGEWAETVLCPDCAPKRFTPLACAKAERGMTTGYDLRPLWRWQAEDAAFGLADELRDQGEQDVSDFEPECCEDCGKPLVEKP